MNSIHLEIEGREVALSEKTNITFVENNNVFSNSASYSYTFDISLEAEGNAEIFDFINRKNKISFKGKMDAILYFNQKQINGCIVVVSNGEKSVRCQFVSKSTSYDNKMNSRVYELDWGDAYSPSDRRWHDLIGDYHFKYYVEREQSNLYYKKDKKGFCYALVSCKKDDLKNGSSFSNTLLVEDMVLLNDFENKGDKGILCTQPFLMYYIDKLPDIFGYTMEENVLEGDKFAERLYISNNVFSSLYGDKLPDWSLSEFIEELEKFFNVSIVIDNNTRSIKVVRADKKIVDIRNGKGDSLLDVGSLVVDDYDREFEKEGKEDIKNRLESNDVAFEFQDSDAFYRFQMLSEDFLNQCEIKEFEDEASICHYCYNLPHTEMDEKVIFRNKKNGDDFFYTSRYFDSKLYPNKETLHAYTLRQFDFRNSDFSKVLATVNKLKPTSERYKDALNLRIIPAPVKAYFRRSKLFVSSQNSNARIVVQVTEPLNRYKKNTDKNFFDTISDSKKSKPSGKVLEIGMLEYSFSNTVCINADNSSHNAAYERALDAVALPAYQQSYIDRFCEFGIVFELYPAITWNNYRKWYKTYLSMATGNGFSLTPRFIKKYYYTDVFYDKKIYKFKLLQDINLSCDKIFYIDGGYYIPISLEWKSKGDVVEGRFYKIIN